MKASTKLWLRSKQAAYFALCRIFGFDRWHYRIVRENCRYFDKVRELYERSGCSSVVEVGCGLGEIVAGMRAQRRIGIDRDPKVIRAARFLRSHSVIFLEGMQPDALGSALQGSGSVCLIFLNWFHACDAGELQRVAAHYIENTNATHVIFDIIKSDARGYRNIHPADVLAAHGDVVAVEDAGDDIRQLVLLECR
ncbi:MAG TPA: hypothetical protein VGN07_01910 [Steroidobacteraceae bacterium]|jgi:SAM-dependent methyltransferase